MNCQARILAVAHTIPNTKLIYHTTTECGGEISKKLSIDSGDAHMNICSCCFRRYNTKGKADSTWYGWFDGSYPPEAKVRGSKWYNEAVAASLVEPEDIEELTQGMEDMSLQEQSQPEEYEAEVEEAEAEVEEAEPEVQVQEVQAEEAHIISKEEKKAVLKARIKDIQASAKPGKMSLKDIQAAFKEITNLKTQIHML